MSDAMDKVRGVRELPIFPLPVVLFPGMPMPLHIFEERYRKMLSDIRAGDNLFGLSYFDASASGKETPPAGHIGCVAEVIFTHAATADLYTLSLDGALPSSALAAICSAS